MDGDPLSKWRDGVRGCWYIRWLVLFTRNGDDIGSFFLICYIYLECVYCSNDLHETQRIPEQCSGRAIVTERLNKSFHLRSRAI
jgi:hypothetical protein